MVVSIEMAEISCVNTFFEVRVIFVVTAMQRTKTTRSMTIVCNVFELAVVVTIQCILKFSFGRLKSARFLPLGTTLKKMGSISWGS